MKKPCDNCPFRSDQPFKGLSRNRAQEIAQSLYRDSSFHCHKTLEYGEDGDGQVTKIGGV